VAAMPLATGASAAVTTRLVVFDSRIPESLDFASRQPGAARIDMAQLHADGWAMLRGKWPEYGAIDGMTRWSDWVVLRGELEARGLRASAENRSSAPLSGRDHLFRWAMRQR
ncbi:MAG TPA: hypothetical protein VN222_07875, partial [Novosphingobium sp.]|nr:hypothetical protein [Novosphingobium sp.]